jgi:hypothetical protein
MTPLPHIVTLAITLAVNFAVTALDRANNTHVCDGTCELDLGAINIRILYCFRCPRSRWCLRHLGSPAGLCLARPAQGLAEYSLQITKRVHDADTTGVPSELRGPRHIHSCNWRPRRGRGVLCGRKLRTLCVALQEKSAVHGPERPI